jgi:hypothetical protein
MKQSAVEWLLSNLKKIELTGQDTDEKIENYKKQRHQIIQEAIKLENELREINKIDNRVDNLKYLFWFTDDEIADGSIVYQNELKKYLDNMQAFKESISFMQGAKWYREQIKQRL